MAFTTKSSIANYLNSSSKNPEIMALFRKLHGSLKGKEKLPYEILESKVRKFLEGRLMPYQMTPEKFQYEFGLLKGQAEQSKVPAELQKIEVLVDEVLGTIGYRHKSNILTLLELKINEGKDRPSWEIASMCGGWEKICKNPHVPFQLMVNDRQAQIVQTARQLKVGIFIPKSYFDAQSLASNSVKIMMYNGYDKYMDHVMVSLENLGKGNRTIADPQIVLLELFNHYWDQNYSIGQAVKKAKIKVETVDDFPFKHRQ